VTSLVAALKGSLMQNPFENGIGQIRMRNE
jgi:hypothetical protein